MTSAGRGALSLAGLLVTTPLLAQDITVEPARPVPGSLIRLLVAHAVADTLIEGDLAGEPLHFHPVDSLTSSALAGVPVSERDSVSLTLFRTNAGVIDTLHLNIPLAGVEYPVEQLSVAPRMAHPDSAARARIRREIARARRVSQASHRTPRQYTEPFQLPRESRITSQFGTGREFNGTVISRHLGTDLDGRAGSPVHATNSGRVVLVARFYLAGRVVYIDHGEGLISAYFHLSRALVQVGQTVERGQLIGLVGQSGRVTGPHLHWVMRYGGVTLDPMSVMALLGPEPGESGPASQR